MDSNTIALLTDFGLHDWFVGVMKGVMLSINPGASVVDISHAVPRHDVGAASFALMASYRYLPAGSVAVVVVDPGVGTERPILCARSAGRIFVAPDNGIIAGLLELEGHTTLVSVENDTYFLKPVSATFHGRDIFAPVAAHLSLGLDPRKLGPEVTDYRRLEIPSPQVRSSSVVGSVRWIDSFGNLITDYPAGLLDELEERWGRDLSVGSMEKGERHSLRIVACYESVEPGGLLAIRGSSGYLEISARERSAAEILGIQVGDGLTLQQSADL
jgi:S-adenosylmethionine hydrolase